MCFLTQFFKNMTFGHKLMVQKLGKNNNNNNQTISGEKKNRALECDNWEWNPRPVIYQLCHHPSLPLSKEPKFPLCKIHANTYFLGCCEN